MDMDEKNKKTEDPSPALWIVLAPRGIDGAYFLLRSARCDIVSLPTAASA